jgi:hypothetical protein
MKWALLLSSLVASSALADGWLEYPVHVEFKSHDLCAAMARVIDKDGGWKATISVRCKGSVMEGAISAAPGVKSIALKIVWPNYVAAQCSEVMKSFPKTVRDVRCEPRSFGGNLWAAQLNYPLEGGREISAIQDEVFARHDKEDKMLEFNPAVSDKKDSGKEQQATGGGINNGTPTRATGLSP